MDASYLEASLPTAGRALATDRPTFRRVDATLVLAAVALSVVGLLVVYSATHQAQTELHRDPGFFVKRQAFALVVALVMMAAVSLLDYQWWKIYAPFLYATTVVLLVLVQTPLGMTSLGAQRWFQISGFQLSPSQFARLGLIAMVAAYLSDRQRELELRNVIAVAILAGIPMVLVFIQPDMGTSIILAAIVLAMLVVAGAKARHLAILALAALIGIFGAFQLNIVKDYQIQRLTSFLDPQNDAQSAGYNRLQAEIAIGSGGLTGRGYLKGTQTNLNFVPAQRTDFIFTVVGEEFGFAGAVALLGLFALLLWRAFRVALLAKDPFGTFIAVGVAAMFAIQLFINVGMTIGIMPITGIPLPFLSYGGSALIADFVGVGLLLNVYARRLG
jgi:rod shape determining protein RodA